MPSPLPRRNHRLLFVRFTCDSGLPRSLVGSASASILFEACSAFTHVTACMLAKFLKEPSTPEAPAASLPPRLLQLLPVGTKVTGRDSHPLEDSALARRTGQYMYFPQTTNDLKTCAGPGGSPFWADTLSTIGSFLLAPGGWDARCAEQSAEWSRRRASCAAADRVVHGLSGRWLPTTKTRLRLVCCGPGRRLVYRPAVRSLHRRGCCGSLWLPGEATASEGGCS